MDEAAVVRGRAVLVAVAALVAGACGGGDDAAPAPPTTTTAAAAPPGAAPADRPFPAGDAWWAPIADDPVLDPASDELVAALADPAADRVANLRSFAVPVYEADAGTPRHRVEVTLQGADGWGDNVLAHTDVPIPDGATPAPGASAKLVVVDAATDLVYDLWQAARTGEGWRVAWGGIYPLGGDGSSAAPAVAGPHAPPPGTPLSRGTGSGVSSLAGLVRVEELAAGDIPHALAFSSDLVCGPRDTGPFRWPATTTDGWRLDGPCLEAGTRVQLDPAVDLDAIPELSAGERAIGRALQVHGAYVVDNGGARLAFALELPTGGDPYADVGLTGDFFPLDRLPWERLRVLASWDGGPQAAR